jgi:hypothetical protein
MSAISRLVAFFARVLFTTLFRVRNQYFERHSARRRSAYLMYLLKYPAVGLRRWREAVNTNKKYVYIRIDS